MNPVTCTCAYSIAKLRVVHCPMHAAAARIVDAADRLRTSLGHGIRELTGQGYQSAAFQSRADETAAAFRDLWAAVAEAKGEPA